MGQSDHNMDIEGSSENMSTATLTASAKEK